MSVINSSSSHAAADRIPARSPQAISQSLGRLAADSKIGQNLAAASTDPVGKLDTQGRRVQTAMASLQDAVSAVQTVDGIHGGMTEILSRLQLAAVTLQVEKENLSSVLTPIRDEAGAGEASQSAKSGILVQPGLALRAQANLAPHSALPLLER